jgi:vancomycin resistance protein YoaR
VDYNLNGKIFPTREVVDTHAIELFLAQSLSDALHDPTDAHFVAGKKSIFVADEAPGQALPVASIVARVNEIVRTLTLSSIVVSTYDVPAEVPSSVLEGHKPFALLLTRVPGFLLTSGTYSWELSGSTIVPMLRYSSSTQALVVNEAKLYAYIKTLANSLIEEPLLEPQFAEMNGRLIVVKEGNPGHDIDVPSLSKKINDWIALQQKIYTESGKIENRQQFFSLKFLTTMPRYSLAELKKLGISGRIGVAETSFKGSSADRIHNIKLGARRVSGFLVEPGEEFSLVQSIGYSEKENGYKEEYVIKGDRSRKEAGGGLCQVATTFFRAALDGGLKITERHNHRYVVGYYGPGLDAGIYAIDHDFRFVNDYAAPILVQVSTKDTNLIVEFFGQPDKRTSVTTKPLITEVLPPPPPDFRFSKSITFGKTECTDHPREGMTSYATTTIRYKSGEMRTVLWKSIYSPWPKICLIGTGGLNIYQQDD